MSTLAEEAEVILAAAQVILAAVAVLAAVSGAVIFTYHALNLEADHGPYRFHS